MLVAAFLVGGLSYQLIEYPTSKLRAIRGRDGRPRDYYPELTSTKKGAGRDGGVEHGPDDLPPVGRGQNPVGAREPGDD
jgi:hypothetical protein